MSRCSSLRNPTRLRACHAESPSDANKIGRRFRIRKEQREQPIAPMSIRIEILPRRGKEPDEPERGSDSERACHEVNHRAHRDRLRKSGSRLTLKLSCKRPHIPAAHQYARLSSVQPFNRNASAAPRACQLQRHVRSPAQPVLAGGDLEARRCWPRASPLLPPRVRTATKE